MQKQKTLQQSFSLQGKGLHTGLDINITFNPAPENHGYKIKRVDLEAQPTLDALAENVAGTQRGTVISKNGVQVSTIEHAMAALYAFEIDNCLIEVDAPEFPILDGSSRFYTEEIMRVGVCEQNAPKDYYIVKHKIEVKDEATGSSLIILPDDKFSINALISFDSPVLPNQFATMNDIREFPTELAAARTFVFVREVEALLQNNLIKGGDLDNAIVIYSDGGSRGNPGPSAAGYVVLNVQQEVIAEGGEYLGITTNNQAEYQGVRLGLEKAIELGYKKVDFKLDSMLVVNQMKGYYKIKNRELWPINERIRTLMTNFDRVTFTHVNRQFNQLADGMVNKTLDAHKAHPGGGTGTDGLAATED